MSERASVPEPTATGPRRATVGDTPALAAMLARAFLDDPVAAWACPPTTLRPAVLERFNDARVRQMVDAGEVWTTPDRTSAAVWAAPERWRSSVREDLEMTASLLRLRLLARIPLVARGLLGVERKHPAKPPHWYLAVLGTDPSAQGRGLGSAVLAPILEECDRDGVGAYLESSKERNIAFYARHGFHVVRELRLPRGPRMWAMWREPRA
jgi:ribosomal protein S18 acetylase RimI-like enzyme